MVNPEIALVYSGIYRLLIAVLIAFIYARAGRGWKIWGVKIRRRVFTPLILCLAWSVFLFSSATFSWLGWSVVLLSFPLYYGTLSIGYGRRSIIRKLVGKHTQQAIVGLIQGGSCGLVAVYSGLWGIYTLACIVPMLTLLILGGFFDNPQSGGAHAAWKELLTGLSIFLFPLFLI